MQLHKVSDTVWHLYPLSAPKEPEHLKAEIHLDYCRQVKSLILRSCTPKERLAAKQLAASHLAQYVRHRETRNFMFRAVRQNHSLTDRDSDNLMHFDAIPEEIACMTEERLDRGLGQYVLVIEAAFSDYRKMFDAAIRRVRTFAISQGRSAPMIRTKPLQAGLVHLPVLFSVPEGSRYAFRFWSSLSRNSDLHIIPSYHPVMQPGYQSTYLINGDTAALIAQSAHGVHRIHCPVQAAREAPGVFGGWEVNHPFYARGHEVRFDIDPLLCVTKEAADLLTEILIAALELNKTFIAVGGGFRAPNNNRVRVTSRGSEKEAVWGYRTLEEERALEGAYIPKWLFEEGYVTKPITKTDKSR